MLCTSKLVVPRLKTQKEELASLCNYESILKYVTFAYKELDESQGKKTPLKTLPKPGGIIYSLINVI